MPLLLISLTGCAASGEKDAVAAAATAVVDAAQRGDGAGACAGLVPRAAASLESGGSRCAEEIVKLGLQGGPVSGVQVWGGNARATVAGQTVFETRWGSGWKVTAAGCRPQGDRPYDCQVEA
ncbi:hypothetical protein [Actinomadura parmotrematis]|uniref:Lipoprotein n=1 Tax=Actinomadura parmotrematis TaxID=2864039 RepID=A0ABS7FPV8_9ACTN|nr:hypothetical protein [Actinomadura parmotrematis]MBW8482444.1 hypothetical protein [Actinomadura parmotrematis]